MTNLIAFARASAHRLTPVLGLLLLTVLFVGGAHQHADDHHHACVVCAAGKSSAVAPAGAVPAPRAAACDDAIATNVGEAPRAALPRTCSPRAPPAA